MKIFPALGIIGLSLFSSSILAQEPASTTNGATQSAPTETPKPAAEEEDGFSFGVEFDVNSIYGWRGIASSSGAVAQPSAWASIKGINVSAWSSITTNEADGFGNFQELDLVANYELEAAGFTLTPKISTYLIPQGSSAEVEIAISHSIAGPLGAYVINSVGFAGAPGSYFGQVGLDASHDFDSGLSLEAQAGLGVGNGIFNDFNLGLKESGLNALMAGGAAGSVL